MKYFVAAVLPLLVACGTNISSIPVADNSSADAVFRDVNRYRTSLGKAPLVRHPGLDALAQRHSESMMRNGKTPNHQGFSDRVAAARSAYHFSSMHENTATGPRGTSFTRVWAASRAHAPAMRAKWTYTGIGLATGKDGYLYATQIFASGGLQAHP
mgnify:CR=1 FL=1